jgi:opacity protein-like surface antigen
MKKIVVSTFIVSATLGSLQVVAGGMDEVQERGFYAQIEGGYAQLDTNTNLFAAQKVDKGDFSYGLRGGYEIPLSDSWLWGIEAGYFNFGKTSYINTAPFGVNVDIKQQGGDLLAVIKKNFNNGLNLYGKAGAAYVYQDVNLVLPVASSTGLNINESKKFLPEIAGGVGYQISDKIVVTGSVNHIFGNSLNSNTTGIRVASATAGMIGLRLNLG